MALTRTKLSGLLSEPHLTTSLYANHRNMNTCTISFPDSKFNALSIATHQPLAEVLTVQNAPILFGCRTGICGTCLVEVDGDIPPPNDAERELLNIVAPNTPTARLACQIDLTCDVAIAPLTSQT